MSLYPTTPSLSSFKLSPSPSIIAPSEFTEGPSSLPANKTLHIANIPFRPLDSEAIYNELQALLIYHSGFLRLKVKSNRTHTACFGIAYFADLQAAAIAKEKLQNHPFTGSSEGLRVEFMTIPKGVIRKEVSNQNLRVSPAQPRRLQQQRSYDALSSGNRGGWGHSSASSFESFNPSTSDITPYSTPQKTSCPPGSAIGDKPFNFNYAAKKSSKGLMGSIYAGFKAPDPRTDSTKDSKLVDAEPHFPLTNEGIGMDDPDELKNPHPVPTDEMIEKVGPEKPKDAASEFGTGQEDIESDRSFNLLKLITALEYQEEQKKIHEKISSQEKSKEVNHANRMMLAKKLAGDVSVPQDVAVEKAPPPGSRDFTVAVSKEEIISTPQDTTIDDTTRNKNASNTNARNATESNATTNKVTFGKSSCLADSSKVAVAKPEEAINPKFVIEDWDDEF